MLKPMRYYGLHEMQWRVGRKVGRTIYAIVEEEGPEDHQRLVGMMDTPALAAAAVRAHNAILACKDAYYCPTLDQMECPHHTVCECGHPELHEPEGN